MKARPILFSGEMVRALLDGRKTQTRRIFKVRTSIDCEKLVRRGSLYNDSCTSPDEFVQLFRGSDGQLYEKAWFDGKCHYGKAGDLLWVRESIQHPGYEGAKHFVYSADGKPSNYEYVWKTRHVVPSVHMPRWASRLTLEITDVRVERLQDISEEEAVAEGCEATETFAMSAADNFRLLWECINGSASWDANPYVWVLEFKVHQCNVDDFIKARRQ